MVARLFARGTGPRKVGSATVVPIINMVDDQARHEAARAAARLALASSDRLARIVLARMTAPDPVIEVVAP